MNEISLMNRTIITKLLSGLFLMLVLTSCLSIPGIIYDSNKAKSTVLSECDSVKAFYATGTGVLGMNYIDDTPGIVLDSLQANKLVGFIRSSKSRVGDYSSDKDGIYILGMKRGDVKEYLYGKRKCICLINEDTSMPKSIWRIPRKDREAWAEYLNGIKAKTEKLQVFKSYSDQVISMEEAVVIMENPWMHDPEKQGIDITFHVAHGDMEYLCIWYVLWKGNDGQLHTHRSVSSKKYSMEDAVKYFWKGQKTPSKKERLIDNSAVSNCLLRHFPRWMEMSDKERMDSLDAHLQPAF